MLTKEIFSLIFPLTKEQPWLTDKASELEQLLIHDCKDAGEQNLILSLLHKFRYLTRDEFQESIERIVISITSEEKYSQENTIIVATTMDENADSAQFVLYAMKPIFQMHGWNKPKLVNRANKIIRNFPDRTHVVYVDEFVGSGRSMEGRIRTLEKELKGNGYNDYSIRVYSVAASVVGADALKHNGVDFYSEVLVQKGISDLLKESKDENLARMQRLESELLQEYEGRQLPKLGYGEVEALYARQDGNTPNNVFPIFWWKFYKNGDARPTILIRSMGDA